jgi:hypothetical protein
VIVDGRLRRYHRLTPSGMAALSAEAERLRPNARIAAATPSFVSRRSRQKPSASGDLANIA